MARRPGPPKKPTALEELQGRPGKRAANAQEPQPDAAASVQAPAWVNGDALLVWRELAPELHRLGLLTKLDISALAGGCRWWAIYRKADRILQRNPLTQMTTSVGRTKRPEIEIARTAFSEAMHVFERFGVTPSERTRLKAPMAKPAGEETPPGGADQQPGRDPLDQLEQRRQQRRDAAAGTSPA